MIFVVAVTLVASLLALAALVLLEGGAELAVYEVLLVAATLTLVRRLGTHPAGKPLWLWERKPRDTPDLPPQIEAMRRSVESANHWSFEADRRLLPRLRSLAEEGLREFHSIDVASHPWGARRLLGETTWQLLWPDEPEPTDRSSTGIDMNMIVAAVTAIERLGQSQHTQSIEQPDALRLGT